MKYKKITVGFILFTLTLIITACGATTRGSGTIITESRTVSDFDTVELLASGDLIITQGESESLIVEVDDNIMQYVNSDVRDGTLYLSVGEDGKSFSYTKLVFTLTVKELSGLTATGSGDITAANLKADHFDVDVAGSGKVAIDTLVTETLNVQISGSGDVSIAGETQSQTAVIKGSGEYTAGDLSSKTAVMDISGSGTATIWVTDSLDAKIAASGDVSYYGSPAVSSDVTGSGEINELGDK